jgi:hypothetical protein
LMTFSSRALRSSLISREVGRHIGGAYRAREYLKMKALSKRISRVNESSSKSASVSGNHDISVVTRFED